ncbi:MAG: hypothetical protein H8D67_17350 [Deltaproteobacteria bacterium]|nr:hypothetical protein [Deltaproteobacteria bacterium]MBL7075334.1 hypothetical protein [candidate division KSB1 bacterium]
MTINGLIKSTKDKALMAKILNDPVQTCKELGEPVDIGFLDNLGLPLFTESTVMQGGYRP